MRAKHLSLGICFALLAAFTSVARAQLSFSDPGPKTEVIMQPEVQKELKISREQLKQINAAMQSMSQTNPASMTSMSDVNGMMASMDAQTLAPLTPDQVTRLNELWLQYEGPRVLRDKTVSDKLQLSADQLTKMGDIWDAYQKVAMDQIEHMHPGSRMDGVKKAMKDANDQTLALLTPDQLKAFTDMQGKPLKFRTPKQM